MEINKAIEEAERFGFTKQLKLINGVVIKMFSKKAFFKEEFAIVKTYPVDFAEGYIGTISYVVLDDCTLGYLLRHRKRRLGKHAVEKGSHFVR